MPSYGIRLSLDKVEGARLLDAAFPRQTRSQDIRADKLDIALVGRRSVSSGDELFGIVHAKVSIAERRTDDIPMSEAVLREDYPSFMMLMDAKSYPNVGDHKKAKR